MRYYLAKKGIKYKFKPTKTSRKLKMKFQKMLYGFSEYEAYSLDETMEKLLYERLIQFRKDAFKMIDGSYHEIEIIGITHTQEEWVDILISLLEDSLTKKGVSFEEEDLISNSIWRIWQHIYPSMWW